MLPSMHIICDALMLSDYVPLWVSACLLFCPSKQMTDLPFLAGTRTPQRAPPPPTPPPPSRSRASTGSCSKLCAHLLRNCISLCRGPSPGGVEGNTCRRAAVTSPTVHHGMRFNVSPTSVAWEAQLPLSYTMLPRPGDACGCCSKQGRRCGGHPVSPVGNMLSFQ